MSNNKRPAPSGGEDRSFANKQRRGQTPQATRLFKIQEELRAIGKERKLVEEQISELELALTELGVSFEHLKPKKQRAYSPEEIKQKVRDHRARLEQRTLPTSTPEGQAAPAGGQPGSESHLQIASEDTAMDVDSTPAVDPSTGQLADGNYIDMTLDEDRLDYSDGEHPGKSPPRDGLDWSEEYDNQLTPAELQAAGVKVLPAQPAPAPQQPTQPAQPTKPVIDGRALPLRERTALEEALWNPTGGEDATGIDSTPKPWACPRYWIDGHCEHGDYCQGHAWLDSLRGHHSFKEAEKAGKLPEHTLAAMKKSDDESGFKQKLARDRRAGEESTMIGQNFASKK